MRKVALFVAGALVLAGVFAGVGTAISADSAKSVQTTIVPAANQAKCTNPAFGFDLFKHMVRKDQGKNVFISPTSVSLCLSMVYNGAGGKTEQSMAKALKLEGMELEEVNKANAALVSRLVTPDSGLRLDIANSIWTRNGVKCEADFLGRNKEFYHAEITDLDFSAPSAIPTINDWVKKNTQGKIDSIIDYIDPNMMMVLVNAVYFKGTWAEQFRPTLTKPETFNLVDGKTKSVPMMNDTMRIKYLKGKGFTAVSIPYANETTSMYVFLPDKESNLDAFLAELSADSYGKWVSAFEDQLVQIKLPRFKADYQASLNDALVSMGMGEAFATTADFRGISSVPLWIGQVAHKTYLEVNEEGTEAAAVTGTLMMTGPRPEYVEFTVDRPFFCAIRDNTTGETLFMGAIHEPM